MRQKKKKQQSYPDSRPANTNNRPHVMFDCSFFLLRLIAVKQGPRMGPSIRQRSRNPPKGPTPVKGPAIRQRARPSSKGPTLVKGSDIRQRVRHCWSKGPTLVKGSDIRQRVSHSSKGLTSAKGFVNKIRSKVRHPSKATHVGGLCARYRHCCITRDEFGCKGVKHACTCRSGRSMTPV